MAALDGQLVACIGGASGMGYGVAEVAVAQGASVIVTSRGVDRAEEAAAALGPRARGAAVDINDDASVSAFFERIDRVDHLMITAGAQGRSSFADTPPDQAKAFMEGKLWANHRVVWQGREKLRPDGSVTLLTGGYAQWATPDAAHVHTAFAATEALARSVAVSLAPLRCNVIRPGFVDTGMWDFLDEAERSELIARERDATLTGRVVTPADVGDVAVALMSCTAVTGVVVPVDGGRHLRPIG